MTQSRTFSASQDARRKGGTGRRQSECRSEDDDLTASGL